MADIEYLISQLDDPELRGRLETEVRSLKERKRFGLVFEEHVPEECALPGLPVEVGTRVQDRTEPTRANYRVLSVKGDRAQIQPVGGGEAFDRSLRDLHVVRRFGEPIYPVLTPISRLKRSDERPWHTVIEGENYHALQMALYLYEGKVDCIYLDPPYNTGARDWKYNNRYVDETDTWRHSKWLAFMEKRLALARRLLKPESGVLICTIDEHEVHHLGMLLEWVFSGYSTYMVTIVHNPKGTYKKNFARVDEYAFFCVPIDSEPISPLPGELFSQVSSTEELDAAAERETRTEDLYLRRRGQESGNRRQRPNQFYAILVDEDTRQVVGLGPPLAKDDPYEVTRDGSVVTVYPLDTRGDERVWRYSRDTMQEYIDAGEIVVTGYSKRAKQGWVLNHRIVRKPDKRGEDRVVGEAPRRRRTRLGSPDRLPR